jgi:rubrerythrin
MVVHQFSDREALRIAAEIERKGERFYRMAQGVAKDGPAYNLMEMLRQQEQAHAQRFEGMLERLTSQDEEEDVAYDMETNAFLSAIAAEVVFPGGVLASLMNRRLETVRDILLYAISSEKDSLLFYMEMLLETKDESFAQVFREIISEEKKHLYDLQRLLEKAK